MKSVLLLIPALWALATSAHAQTTSPRATELYNIPVDSKYNAQIFRIRNDPSPNAAYVLPKLYAFMGSDISQSMPKYNKDRNTVTFSFPVMMVDGLTASVPSPNSSFEMLQIPNALLVQNKEELQQRLGATLTAPMGCPTELTFVINGKAYKDQSSVFNPTTGLMMCNYNTVIYTSVEIPMEDAQFLLNGGLRAGYASLKAVFNIYAPFTISHASIQFDKRKLYEDIETRLRFKKPLLADVEVHLEVEKAVREQALRIVIQGDVNAQINNVIDQAIAQFFQKMPADPNKPDMSCGNEIYCFKFNASFQDFRENLTVTYEYSSNELARIPLFIETPLRSIFDKEIRFENLSSTGAKVDTGLILSPNDELELHIASITYERVVQDIQNARQSNIVRIPYQTERRCPSSGGGGRGGHFAEGGNADNYCPVTEYRNEDHWSDITTYGPRHEAQTVTNPSGQFDQITDSIYFEFSWFEKGQLTSVICPSNVFERVSDGKNLVLKINNVPGCNLFSAEAQNKPQLAILNKNLMNYTSEILVGRLVKNWQNQTLEQPVTQKFGIPRVSYSGRVSIHYKNSESHLQSFARSLKRF